MATERSAPTPRSIRTRPGQPGHGALGNWVGHGGAIFGFSTVTFYNRSNGAQIVTAASLSSNSSTSTATLFGLIAKRLYPASLQ